MAVEDHIIRQTTLNFRFHHADNKFAVPGKVESWFLTRAMDEIGGVCDDIAGNGALIEIDEIRIDLGILTERQFESEIDLIFRNELNNKIKTEIADKHPFAASKPGVPPKSALSELLVSFLEKGYLPWKSSFSSTASLEKEILATYQDHPLPALGQLAFLISKGTIRQRLAFNFSGQFILWLMREIAGKLSLTTDGLGKEITLNSCDEKEKAIARFEQLVSGSAIKRRADEPPELTPDIDSVLQDAYEIENPRKDEKERSDEGIFVSNAGVVLLHPFFSALFDNLGLMSDHTFKDDQAREKAIWLLYYVVNGHLKLDEAQVVLLKLLCGISVNAPLYYSPSLSQKEKKEVETVIEHAIKYWEILKNTSVDSFRETFLQRDGCLKIHTEFIELNVEQQSVDMLIGHLPWALSVISLSWLDKKLHINWA